MKKWLVYILGIITGIILTFVFAFCINLFNNSGIIGLELFEEPGENMDYSNLHVFQVIESGCALAHADSFDAIVLLIPDEKKQFYDDQTISLRNDQRIQRVGTYRYGSKMGIEKTVPAVRIIDSVETPNSNKATKADETGKVLFDSIGDFVSKKNFQVKEVLESGDAIASEIEYESFGNVFTTDLEVLIMAEDGGGFYNNQIVKAPQGKCARQIGTYKYKEFGEYGDTKVIPIIAFK